MWSALFALLSLNSQYDVAQTKLFFCGKFADVNFYRLLIQCLKDYHIFAFCFAGRMITSNFISSHHITFIIYCLNRLNQF